MKDRGKKIKDFLTETSVLTEEEADKLWSIRNELAHEFRPKIMPAAGITFVPGADFVNLIFNYKNQPVFCLTKENSIGIDSNALNHKLEPLLQHIIEKIEKLEESDEKLKNISKYLFESEKK